MRRSPSAPNQCMQYAAETEKTRPILEAGVEWLQNIDHIEKYHVKTVLGEGQGIVSNRDQSGNNDQKYFPVCLKASEANHLLWAASSSSEAGPLKARYWPATARIGQQEEFRVSPEQHQTIHYSDDLSLAKRDRIGDFAAYAIEPDCSASTVPHVDSYGYRPWITSAGLERGLWKVAFCVLRKEGGRHLQGGIIKYLFRLKQKIERNWWIMEVSLISVTFIIKYKALKEERKPGERHIKTIYFISLRLCTRMWGYLKMAGSSLLCNVLTSEAYISTS